MVRWEPAARERLQSSALELFATIGFDETTVAEIAAATGLTERTFYRHFADKREVVFGGQDEFQRAFIEALNSTPKDGAPLDQIAAAVETMCAADGPFLEERRVHSRLRQRVIDAHPELQERELLKMSSLSRVLAKALRERGVSEPTASLAAESGVTVFRLSFEQWVDADSTQTLAVIEKNVFASLRQLSPVQV